MASLADYVEQVRTWVEEVPVAEKPGDRVEVSRAAVS